MGNRLLAGVRSHLRSSQACYRASQLRLARDASFKATSRSLCAVSAVTKVEKLVLDTIKGSATSSTLFQATGPISFSTYMQLCLSHPTDGYYSNPSHPVFGAKGDFITSPEISQVFGELVMVWLLSQWLNFGGSKPIRLVELGPGRGTLMADMLRVLSQFPAARAAVSEILLVENSQSMRTMQVEKLQPVAERNKWSLRWANGVEELSPEKHMYTMVVAHEFFDALPFHLLQRMADGWREVLITAEADPMAPPKVTAATPLISSFPSTANGQISSTPLRTCVSPTASATANLLAASSPRFQNLPVGSRLEVAPVSFKIARRIGELLHSPANSEDGAAGCALIVDYGGEKSYGNSFRAFKDHKIVDVFHRPGECDLTTNVDFAYLKDAVLDLAIPLGPLPQGTFLTRMGLQLRVEALKKAAKNEERKLSIEKAANRLVDATGMGSQYQVLAISGSGQNQPTLEQRWPFVDEQHVRQL
ncbi:S-adenosyl-L-methionine-dependent methyltransferase [Cytidiella melzeri]|nr:S-adenosyl-L-methionine-dependent methyltransferase [Cytidiella melzeri]